MDGGIVDIYHLFGGSLWSYSGGNFGSELVGNFCAQNACADFGFTATVECPSPQNGKITVNPVGGTPPFQYSLDGSNFQADPVFSNLGIGIYFVYALDANNCSYQSEVDLCTVSTSEPEVNRRMTVSPNPTTGMAQLELPALDGEQFVVCEILDVKGKQVQETRLVRWDQTLRGMAILDKQPAGVYFAKVRAGNKTYLAKIVKK
jgi:hypothetical protein